MIDNAIDSAPHRLPVDPPGQDGRTLGVCCQLTQAYALVHFDLVNQMTAVSTANKAIHALSVYISIKYVELIRVFD